MLNRKGITMNNYFKWLIILLSASVLTYAFFTNSADPLSEYRWQLKRVCTYQGALFNITAGEYGCPLEQCELIQSYGSLTLVDRCFCPDTKTYVFRYCESYDEITQYRGDVDKLREYILDKNPEIKDQISWNK